ncbi:hypothetical protein RIF29_25425 [Crotalaria pallida]|uniref:Uncharacterized protein n=1 Tax=Crotalaria pallida TaxID=3830 RepID=A0AAN9I132_CROPI
MSVIDGDAGDAGGMEMPVPEMLGCLIPGGTGIYKQVHMCTGQLLFHRVWLRLLRLFVATTFALSHVLRTHRGSNLATSNIISIILSYSLNA